MISFVQIGSCNVRMLCKSGTIRGSGSRGRRRCSRGGGIVGTARRMRRRRRSLSIVGIVIIGGCLFLIA